MSSVGFLLLKNIPEYDEVRYLEACKAFHALPQDVKEMMYTHSENPENKNVYRGYHPFKSNDASHKEFYDLGIELENLSLHEKSYPLYEETPFPEGPEYMWIKEEFSNARKVFFETALKLMRHVAAILGKDIHFFDSWFVNGDLSSMRSIHYEPRGSVDVDSSKLSPDEFKLTTPEHVDSGILTLLTTFGYKGLQVLIDGEYQTVKPVPNTIVVNIGKLLSKMSNYRLKATEHRVLDIGITRYSSPFFFEPRYSAKISQCLLSEQYESAEDIEEEKCVLYGDWLIRQMTVFVEFKDFKIPESRKSNIDLIEIETKEDIVTC
mmetsp:Transcript_14423/g.17820  ORF Transcript_14423/g.17820 Transcript_14423/m.17820 type:complete len:321 (+) Transcript_14423:7-969(+)